MKNIILALVTCFVLTLASAGQVTFEKQLATLPRDDQFRTEYDKFKDITKRLSPNFTVNELATNQTLLGTGIMLGIIYPGKDPSGKAEYYFAVSTASAKGRRLERATTLIVLADGERITLKAVDSNSDVRASQGLSILFGSHTYVEEKIFYAVDRPTLEKIVRAKSVEMQSGDVEFALHGPSLIIFRNMMP